MPTTIATIITTTHHNKQQYPLQYQSILHSHYHTNLFLVHKEPPLNLNKQQQYTHATHAINQSVTMNVTSIPHDQSVAKDDITDIVSNVYIAMLLLIQRLILSVMPRFCHLLHHQQVVIIMISPI